MTTPLTTLLYTTVLKGIIVKPAQLTMLTQAADALVTTLKASPSGMVSLALHTFLPGGQLEGLIPARTALEAQWPTFQSENPDGGLPYIRAVGILAFMALGEDKTLGSGLYLLLIDPLSRQGEKQEAALRTHVLATLRETYQEAAEETWSSVDVSVPSLTVSPPKELIVSEAVVTKAQETIREAVRSAPISNNYDQYGRQQNIVVPEGWATALSDAFTSSVIAVVTSSLLPTVTALGAPLKGIQKFSPALTDAVQAAKLAERRMNVLWWMQARYSPSLATPYRSQGSWAGAYRMAHDLDDLVPAPAPPEVESVLIEAWYVLFGEAKSDTLLTALKTVATQDPAFEGSAASAPTGPVSVIAALKAAANHKLSQKQATSLTGVSASTPITAPELALWVFRVYQAKRLLK